jgi:RNA polymerase sigma-70 factor, ECF subfamily
VLSFDDDPMSTLEQPALHELYTKYGRAVYRRCQYFLHSKADAEDAMHEVFVKVAQSYGEFRGDSAPLTWLVRVTTNHCLNLLRSRKAGWHERYERTVSVDAAERPFESSRLERHEMVRALLTKIDSSIQEAAIYYFVDEMTQEEAAAAARCSVPTLRKRLRDFIKAARKELKRQDADVVFGEEPV